MNSVQLVQRLARNLNVEDPFDLNAEPALDVLSAINAGLAAFYREMPGIYRRTTLSHTLRAPRSLTITFNAQYSRAVATDTFLLREQGCTVRMGNGASDNVVTGQNNVLDDYLGAELSTSAIVYSDVVPIQDVIERIIGNVRLYGNTQSSPTVLVRDEGLRGGRAWRLRRDADDGESFTPPDCGLNAIGRPRYYYLEPMGASQGGEPEFLLRVSPMPDIDYTVRLEAELSTQRIVFADLTTARTIHVADAYLDDILVPLCEAELITSPYWRDPAAVKVILARQEKILSTKIPMVPSDVAPVSNYVGTPPGF